jgi:aspartate aminotransferase
MTRRDWEPVVDLIASRDVVLICDEVYESFVYEGETFVSGASFQKRLGDRLFIVSSVSKSYAMTGWRLGYLLGERGVIAAAARVQSHDASQAPTLSQYAGLAALSGTQAPLADMLAEYARRRAFLVPALREIPELTCVMPRGAFYAFPNVTRLYASLGARTSEELAALLIREAAVLTVPGEGFGAPGFVRISYAAPMSVLKEGIRRITELVARKRR